MFASGKSDWNETDLQESGDGKNRRDEIRAGGHEKAVYWGTSRVAETSRAS